MPEGPIGRVAKHNREMWERLARAGFIYTKPSGRLPRSERGLRKFIDPVEGLSGLDLEGKRVLVLAGGGGWDAVAFSKLGAKVCLVDISPSQLSTVASLAKKSGEKIRLVESDMTDLSAFGARSFDLVWHMHSLVFTDSPESVFNEVSRVLRPAGLYRLETMHPVTIRLFDSWTGTGWRMTVPYHFEGPLPWNSDPTWKHGDMEVEAPTLEFGHTIQRIVGGLSAAGLLTIRVWEHSPTVYDDAAPGSEEALESEFPVFVDVRAQKGSVRWGLDRPEKGPRKP